MPESLSQKTVEYLALNPQKEEDLRNELRFLVRTTSHPSLKDLDVDALTRRDLVWFNRYQENLLTPEEIEQQINAIGGTTVRYLEKVKRIMADINRGVVPKLNDSEELTIYSKIKAGKEETLSPENIAKQEREIREYLSGLEPSIRFLYFLKESLELRQEKAS
jgi:hypothetical protein